LPWERPILLLLLLLLLLQLNGDIQTGEIFSQKPQETIIYCEYSSIHSSVFEDCSFVGQCFSACFLAHQ
jgi:hypothetical protein